MATMNKQIFVDSNFFIELYNKNDTNFAKAEEKSRLISEINPEIVINNYIFSEITTVISQRIDRKTAILAGKQLIQNQQIHLCFLTPKVEEEAWKIFSSITSKNVSFADCSIIATMKALSVNTLLTFDTKDFHLLQMEYKFKLF